MAKATKRIARRDIRQPDQFMVATGRVVEWSKTHRRQLIIAGIAVFVILTAVVSWELYDRSRDRAARVAYNRAVELYESGRYQEALSGFRDVEGYGSTPHGDLAGLYIANAQLALGKAKEAIRSLENLRGRISSSNFTAQLGLLTLALAQEMDNACDGALQTIEQVIAGSDLFQQEALLAKARCSLRVGRPGDALKAYREYLERFPGSDSPGVRLKLQELEAKSAGG